MSYPVKVNSLNPVAYYRLGESSGTVAVDETGNYDGTYFGSPSLGETGLLVGDTDTAVSFSSTSKNSLETTAPLNKDLYSFAAVIKLTSGISYSTILAFGDTSQYLIFRVDTSQRLRVGHYHTTTASGLILHTINVGQTYHVAITYDGTTLTMYLDGVNVGTSTPTPFSTLTPFGRLGDTLLASVNPFKGIIDEVGFFNTALTQSQVTDLYNTSITAPVVQEPVINNYPDRVNSLSPLAYYRLGESSGTTAFDETGTYDGAYAGSPSLGETGLLVGDTDTAVDFSGTVKTGLNFTAPLNKDLYSVSAIINMVSTPSGYTPVIFSFGDASKYISLFVSSSNIRVAHYSPSLSGNISKLITLGQTYHVIITYDGSTLTMYVDGVNVGTSTPTPFSTLTQSGTIGDFVSTTRKNFTGIVDEVAIFNTVLTPVQVTDLYNTSITAPVVQEPVSNNYTDTVNALSPLAYYRLGESSGTVAVDETGNYDGTYIGSPILGETGLLVGDTDTATKFDGVDDYVSLPAIPFSTSSTILLNFQVDSTSLNQAIYVDNNNSKFNLIRANYGSAGLLRVQIYSSNNTFDQNISFTVGQNHQLAVTIIANVSVSVYLDGILVATGSVGSLADLGIEQGTVLGVGRNTTSDWLNGVIDEVAIFDKALTPAQIRELYYVSKTAEIYSNPTFINLTYDQKVLSDNPVAYWPLQETEGELLVDSSNAYQLLQVNGDPTMGSVGFVTSGDTSIDLEAGKSLTSNTVDLSGFATQGTIEFWMKLDTVTGSGCRIFCLGRDVVNQDTIQLVTVGSTFGLRIATHAGGVDSSFVALAGQWFHVAITRNQDLWKLIINGREYAEASIPSSVTHSELLFGDTGQGYPTGGFSVSHVAIYKYPLTKTKLAPHTRLGVRDFTAHVTDTFETYVKGLNPSAYWRLGESKGLIIVDEVDNYHGLLDAATTRNVSGLVPASVLTSTTLTGSRSFSIGKYLRFERTQAFTLSCVVRLSSYGSGSALITSGNGSKGYALYLTSTGKITLYLMNTWSGNALQVSTTNNVISLNKSELITITYDGTSLGAGVKIYLNGIKQDVDIPVDSLSATLVHDFPVQVGQNGAGGEYYSGDLADISIFAKELAAQHVRNLQVAFTGTEPTWVAKEDSHQSKLIELGAIAYYPLDEEADTGYAYDRISGNTLSKNGVITQGTNNLIPSTESTATSFVPASPGALDGGDIHDIGTGGFSIAVSFSANSLPSGSDYQGIVGKSVSISASGRWWVATDVSGIYFGLEYSSTIYTCNIPNIQTNKPYTVVFVLDRVANELRGYVNGAYSSSTTLAGIGVTEITSTAPFRIGGYTAADFSSLIAIFDGTISDVAIFDRTLTPIEVKELEAVRFRARSYERQVNDLNPTNYWPLDDEDGQMLDLVAGYNLSANNVTYQQAGINGKQCAYLEGSTSYLTNASLPTTGLGAYSLEVWIYLPASVSGKIPVNFIPGDQASSYLDRTYLYLVNGSIPFPNANSTTKHYGFPTLDTWHQLVFTRSSDFKHFSLFIDGAKTVEDSYLSSGVAGTANGIVSLGVFYDGSNFSHYSETYAQDLALYDYVLSDEQIAKNFTKRVGKYLGSNRYQEAVMLSTPHTYYPVVATTGSELTDVVAGDNMGLAGATDLSEIVEQGITPQLVSRSVSLNGSQYLESQSTRVLGSVINMSIELMVRLDTVGTQMDLVGSSENSGYLLRVNTDGTLTSIFALGTVQTNHTITTAEVLTTGKSYHIVVTLNNTHLSLYLNGALAAQTATSTERVFYDKTIVPTIGAQYGVGGSSDYLEGRISDLAYYNETLDSATVAEHYLALSDNIDYQLNTYTELLVEQGAEVIVETGVQYNEDHKDIITWEDYKSHGNFTVADGPSNLVSARRFQAGNQDYLEYEGFPTFVDEMTVDVWFKFEDDTIKATDKGAILFYRSPSSTPYVFGLHPLSSNQSIQFYWSTAPTTHIFTTIATSGTAYGSWNHVAFTFKDGVITIYWNGLQVHQETNTLELDQTGTWFIGSDHLAESTRYFTGDIGTVSYSKTAITADEVLVRYNLGRYAKSTYHELMAKSGVVHLWELETDASDLLGSQDGTFQSLLRPVVSNLCKGFTYALNPSSASDCVDLGDLDTPNLNDHEIVIESVIMLTQRGGTRHFFTDGGSTNGYGIGITSGNFGIYTRTGGALNTCTVPEEYLPLNEPIHFIAKLSKTSRGLYINGYLLAYDTTVVSGFNGSTDACIGARAGDGRSPLTGDTSTAYGATWKSYVAFLAVYDDFDYFNQSKVSEHYKASGIATSAYHSKLIDLQAVMHFPVVDNNTRFYDRIGEVGTLIMSGDTAPTLGEGKKGNGLVFSANSSFGISDANATNLNTLNNFSFSGWFYLEPFGADNYALIIKGTASSRYEIIFGVRPTGLIFFDNRNTTSLDLDSVTPVPTGEWVNLTITMSPSNFGSIYINGQLDNSGQLAVVTSNSTSDLTFGSYSPQLSATGYNLNGKMDELVWFNKELSSTEVAELYNLSGEQYAVSGEVTEAGIPVSRTVHVHRRDTGELVSKLTSDAGDGSFQAQWHEADISDKYYVVVFDDDIGADLEAIVHDKLVPFKVN